MGIHSLPARRWGRIGLVALLGLTLALVTVSARHADASSWHKAGATVAKKKKCKKKGKKSAAVAKKKKCKKKKHAVPPVTPPPPAAPKPPVVRAQISWSTDAEIDLHAWSNGLHDGWNETIGPFGDDEVEIPGTTYTHTSSSEQITDSANPSTIPLTFAICNYGDAGTTDISVQVLYSDGTVDNEQFDNTSEGDVFVDPFQQGGDPDPLGDWCPAAVP